MSELNKKACLVGQANTGFGDCVLTMAHVVGAFIVPANKSFSPTDLVDFKATLQEAAFAANKNNRIFPIHNFEQLADNSEDKNVQTLTYGGKYPLTEGDYDWAFQYIQGGHCLHTSLRKFNGLGRSVLFYDAKGIIYGWKDGEALKGIPLVYFFANKFTLSDGSAATAYTAQFVLKPKYMNDSLGFVEPDFDPATVSGLQDVVLTAGATAAPDDPVMKAVVGCGGSDMSELYETELAVPGAWKVTHNGQVVSLLSVVYTPAVKGWTLSVDPADPNYSATAATVVSLEDPLALELLGVVGFASNSVSIAV